VPVAGPSPPIAPPGSVAPSAPAGPRGNGAVRAPVAPSAGGKQERSGRRYRIAGLLVAVIALIAAAVIALLVSNRSGAAGNGHGGQGAPGTGAGQRNLAAAWVAGQVSRTAVVACDPVMCRALAESGRAHDQFARSAGYVRSMVSFLHAQRIPFRPAHVATVHLAGGTKALRVEFPAPSPMGLLGAHRA
jgi:hypothetical protein